MKPHQLIECLVLFGILIAGYHVAPTYFDRLSPVLIHSNR